MYTINEIEHDFDGMFIQTDDHNYFIETGWWSRLSQILSNKKTGYIETDESLSTQINTLKKHISLMDSKMLIDKIIFTILDEIIDDCQITHDDDEKEETQDEINFWEDLKVNLIQKTESPIGYEPYDILDNIKKMIGSPETESTTYLRASNNQVKPVPPEIISSIEKLIEYNWASESTSFEECTGDNGIIIDTDNENPSMIPEEMKDHIFYHILVINQWLKSSQLPTS